MGFTDILLYIKPCGRCGESKFGPIWPKEALNIMACPYTVKGVRNKAFIRKVWKT